MADQAMTDDVLPAGEELDRVGREPAQMEDDSRAVPLVLLCLLALCVGFIGGLGAVVFRGLIAFVHNLLFLGHLSFFYDSSLFTPASPWGAFVILVPVVGAIGVTFIVIQFAPEAKGHGVPEVMDAIYYNRGVIRPIVAAAKSLASALAIGSGAAVGREGPIIQIGSAFGSTLGQVVRMSMGQRIILVAAGAGAGIAATFNTPIGGVLFATELMMPEISVNTFLPVALSTGTATFIGRLFFGDKPAFDVPANLAALPAEWKSAAILLFYVILGAVIGVAAALFVRSLHWAEDLFDKIPGNYARHMLGMLLVGILIYALMRWGGHFYVEGVGYATIQATLTNQLSGASFLLLLYVAKLLATSLSLGSGSSGGIFSPSLFMGATLGGAFAGLVGALFPGLSVSVPAFAMVGMGTMVGAGTGAAMTAIAMVFEMTRDYNIVLPMVLAVGVGLGVRRLLSRENIYTMKLFRRGHPIPKALHANMFLVRGVVDVMDRDFLMVDGDWTFDEFLSRCGTFRGMRNVVVTRAKRIVGVLRVNTDLRRTVSEAGINVKMQSLMQRDFAIVRKDMVVFDVIARLRRRKAVMGVVVAGRRLPRSEDVIGVVTKEHIADEVANSVRMYQR
jgi:CIC family chloride channel protein